MSDMVRLAIDFENPGEQWWASGGRELWEALVEGFDGNDVVVDRSLADSWLAQAAEVPGWDAGPTRGAPTRSTPRSRRSSAPTTRPSPSSSSRTSSARSAAG